MLRIPSSVPGLEVIMRMRRKMSTILLSLAITFASLPAAGSGLAAAMSRRRRRKRVDSKKDGYAS